MEGLVYKSTGSWYILKTGAGNFINARIKGRLKIDKKISSTNPVAVGDIVEFQMEEEGNNGIISSIKDRKNHIVRVSPSNKNQQHIIAANLDLALLVATINEPRTSQGFIDRFLITAEAYQVPAVVVFNKIDLLREEEQLEQLAAWTAMYEDVGYKVVTTIATSESGLEPLKALIHNKTTLFCGHSGVGKSTLINQLIPDAQLRTGKISDWSGKGLHTTTFSEMLDLPFGGKIIDTPGVKEFGLIHMEKPEVAHFFPEIKRLIGQCKFNNCMHINEPGCAVKTGVNSHEIAMDRYLSYLSIVDSIESKW